MGRPSIEESLRSALREYLERAELQSAEEAPLNTLAVARALEVDRKTIKKYGLDTEITSAAKRQLANATMSPRQLAHRETSHVISEQKRQIAEMTVRCEALLARLCSVEENAKRLGIDPSELWKPMRMPDRRLPHTGKSGSGKGPRTRSRH